MQHALLDTTAVSHCADPSLVAAYAAFEGETTMDADVIIVGAGVIGLAIARQFALAGSDVLVLEAEDRIGTHTSSRNSEVIHAGIYYPPGSMKAELCVVGRELLYSYCAAHGVPASPVGKLIVATNDAEVDGLHRLLARGHANGVTDLRLLSASDVTALEPEVRCVAGVLSPSTGIIDTHAFMLALQGEAEAHGAQIVVNARVETISSRSGVFIVSTGGDDAIELTCRKLINSAGFSAQQLASRTGGLTHDMIPPTFFAKGNYFGVSGATPFKRLIYPMPVSGGLGVHVTLDLAGRMRLGPDVHWVSGVDYARDESMLQQFYQSVATYWPAVQDRELHWTYSGVRPKISGPHDPVADFQIQGPRQHGLNGLVNLFGIESPGLTSSLAIARKVADEMAWK